MFAARGRGALMVCACWSTEQAMGIIFVSLPLGKHKCSQLFLVVLRKHTLSQLLFALMGNRTHYFNCFQQSRASTIVSSFGQQPRTSTVVLIAAQQPRASIILSVAQQPRASTIVSTSPFITGLKIAEVVPQQKVSYKRIAAPGISRATSTLKLTRARHNNKIKSFPHGGPIHRSPPPHSEREREMFY